MEEDYWDIFMKTGTIGAYLAYRRQSENYDDYYNYEIWPDEGEKSNEV